MFRKIAFSNTQYTFMLCATLLMLAVFAWLEQRYHSNTEAQLQQAYIDAQQVVIDKELICINMMQNYFGDTQNMQRNWSSIIERAETQNSIITIFKNDTLLLWTSNALNGEEINTKLKTGAGFIQASNGYYLTYKQQRGSYTYLFYYALKTEYPFRNQYIENQFDKEINFIKEGFIFGKPLENFVNIHSLNNSYLFSLQIFSFTETTPTWLIIAVLGTLFLLLLLAHILARQYILVQLWPTTIVFLGLFIYLRWLNIFYHVPEFIYTLKLFDPQIYASSVWFPSLGDLLLNALFLLWYLILLETKTSKSNTQPIESKQHVGLRFALYLLLCFSSAHIGITFIRSLTLDSQISFNINTIFTINLFTYLGLMVCIIISLCIYFVSRNFIRFIKHQKIPLKHTITTISIAFIVYSVCAHFLLETDGFHTLVTVLILALFFIFKSLTIKLNRFQQYFVVIFISAFISSISINHWLTEKEIENRKLFAGKLVSQNDITTDYFLRNVEKK